MDGGPTSYNSWPSGYPGGVAVPNVPGAQSYSASADKNSGRVSATGQLRAFAAGGGSTIATGTADQLLAQLSGINSSAEYYNRYMAGDHTANLQLANGQVIDFDNTTQLANYLQRSTAPLIPNEIVAGLFTSVLGRPGSTDDIASIQTHISNGGALSTARWTMAHSTEAVARVGDIYRSVFGRDPDGSGLQLSEDALGGGMSLRELRSNAAHSFEAQVRIGTTYSDTLGRRIQGWEMAIQEDSLAVAGTLAGMRSSLAYSVEAANRVNATYSDTVARVAGDIAGTEGTIASGWSIAGLRTTLAYSAEAAGKIGGIYLDTVARVADNVVGTQESIAAGWSLAGLRSTLAYSGEAEGKIKANYLDTVCRTPNGDELASQKARKLALLH